MLSKNLKERLVIVILSVVESEEKTVKPKSKVDFSALKFDSQEDRPDQLTSKEPNIPPAWSIETIEFIDFSKYSRHFK